MLKKALELKPDNLLMMLFCSFDKARKRPFCALYRSSFNSQEFAELKKVGVLINN
jgi:hypothetical protein|tara:strand:- start:172 stop:336 length:165 start_codon:yes stop_codon:yes gene_type:complete